MMLPLLLSVLTELSALGVMAEPCGGMKGVYVCNPASPSHFDICIGDQKYTMSCPGGLHFNARTQICDWPQNADCGKSPSVPTPFTRTGPKPFYRMSSHPPMTQAHPDVSQAHPHNHQQQEESHVSQNQNGYDRYDSQQQDQDPSRRYYRRRYGGHRRGPQTSDARYHLYGSGRQHGNQNDNIARYNDGSNNLRPPKSGYSQNPLAYKLHNAPAAKNGPSEYSHDNTDFKANVVNTYDFKASKSQVLQNNDHLVNGQDDGKDYNQHAGSDDNTIYNSNNDHNNNNGNSNYNNDDNDSKVEKSGRKDRYRLHHYPWWASRSATPRSLRLRFSPPTVRPPGSYSGRFQEPSKPQHQQGLVPSYQPAAAPRQVQQQQQRPPVSPQQPLSAAAAAPPPANSITAAAASAPKLTKKPRKTGYCSPKTCQLPDCRCVGADIPGDLDVKDTPQMVMLTFDDSVNIANFDYYMKLFDESKFRNPSGCPVKGTFFVSGDATQYHYVDKLYKRGHEIASHSMTHRSPTTYWANAGYKGYVEEIEGMRKKLSKESNVPHDDIRGMRVPFLQVGGDDQYQMLEDYEFKYDTSMVTGHLYQNDHAPIWPFTLDYPPDSKTCSLTPCPTKSYPGLWEVPLIRWYGSNRLACAMPDGCTIDPGTQGTLRFLEDNFRRHYETNRSPLGIFLHASWFRRKDGNLEGLMAFLDKLNNMKDVWVVSVSQVIDWIQNPVPNSQAGSIPSWQC